MTEERLKRLAEVVRKRQTDLTVVLNNVHDPHNIGAVLRTCDSVGIPEIYVLYTEDRNDDENLLLGKKAAASARKWVDVFLYTDAKICFDHIKSKYDRVLGTHLGVDAVSVYDIDFTSSVAMVFGNEHLGIDNDVLKYLDGNFIIPQVGMVQSLNISVSAAISLYEALRQREKAGKYDTDINESPVKSEMMLNYIERHREQDYGKLMTKIKSEFDFIFVQERK
jgi:tRNA (guanosine-2'-O-)-methyltransferase